MSLPGGLGRGVRPAELRDLYERAVEMGCEITVTAKQHVRLALPNGKVVFGSMTSSDRNSVKACRSQLRRAGLDI